MHRTCRRSTIVPAIELHADERGWLEFRLFEATSQLEVYRAYLLLWYSGSLFGWTTNCRGRTSSQTRIYGLGQARTAVGPGG